MRTAGEGNEIEVELYELPIMKLGNFMRYVQEPLAIGDIELVNGRVVKGFLCQEYATEAGRDITERGKY